MDYVLDELLALDADQIKVIFSWWSEPEAAHNLQVIGSLQDSIRHARRWTAPIDDKHVNGIESALLDVFLYHLADENTDPAVVDLEGLREALGIIICTWQHTPSPESSAGVTISHVEALPTQTGKRQAATMDFL